MKNPTLCVCREEMRYSKVLSSDSFECFFTNVRRFFDLDKIQLYLFPMFEMLKYFGGLRGDSENMFVLNRDVYDSTLNPRWFKWQFLQVGWVVKNTVFNKILNATNFPSAKIAQVNKIEIEAIRMNHHRCFVWKEVKKSILEKWMQFFRWIWCVTLQP